MKSTFAIVAAVASVAYAQLPDIPSCALNCVTGPIMNDGCDILDFECHCTQTSLLEAVTPCVQAACTSAEEAEVISLVEGLCASVGAPISISLPAEEEPSAASTLATVSPTEIAITDAPVVTNMEPMPSFTDIVITPSVSATPVPLPTPVPSPPPFEGAAARVVGGFAAVVVAGVAVVL